MKRSRSALFLMEMILMILFFAGSSGICVDLFAKAHLLRNVSTDLNHAVIECQTIAETFKHCGGESAAIVERIGGSLEDYTLFFYYDSNWKRVSEADDAIYIAKLRSTPQNDLIVGELQMFKDQAVVYELQLTVCRS